MPPLRTGTSLKVSLNVSPEILIPLFRFGVQNFWLSICGRWRLWYPCQSPTSLRGRVLAWEHCCLSWLGPSQPLLPCHLLHGSLKRRVGKCLPDMVGVHGILPWWREGTLGGLWMSPLALPFYDVITHMWWRGKQIICGLSTPCSAVPVTVVEFWLNEPGGTCQSCTAVFLLETCSFGLSLHQYSGMLCPTLLMSSPRGVFTQARPP